MTTYLALLRGINVGGNSLIKMADLKLALAQSGLQNVRTYIQSGNVVFESEATDTLVLAQEVSKSIKNHFKMDVQTVVFSKKQWSGIIATAPKWWGADKEWKHNLLVMIPPFTMPEIVAAVGQLKPDIEAMQPGNGVLYQSMSLKLFGRTTTGKLASNPVYKQMTIRNYNTATKLVKIMD